MERIRYRLVYNRKNKLNSQGAALVQVEASLKKRKMYFTTRTYVKPCEWNRRTSTVVNHPHATELNAWLYEYVMKFESFELGLWKRGIVPTLSLLKEAVKGSRVGDLSFNSFSVSVINKSQRAPGTKCSLLGTLSAIREFRPGYTWDDLTYTFLKDFELWLSRKGAAVNTVAKHLQNLRTLVNEAISSGYIPRDNDPFRNYSIRHEKVEHRFLNPDDLKKMEDVKVEGRLAHVRDAFLFCCYTGLRFSDFKRMKREHIQKVKGKLWLFLKTEKTGYEVKIPLFLIFNGKAQDLILKYPTIDSFTDIGCNADTNKRLAILQRMAGIRIRTTFHTARHTCATLLCHQGVPITTIQKILGHTKLTTTQLYSEVMADTIVKDLCNVRKNKRKGNNVTFLR